ncbi:hypothetical protein CHS0354_036207 [Potamilus streckersoni]|uniref:UBC core domain-containing protein n=2 Tax=Potamilus streckersoni TaxID=2493646 RepID=A0AAE0SVW7_9BIVA|nr:hypothetical protein CHS0354_036207 [Potamilus streckersoni]
MTENLTNGHDTADVHIATGTKDLEVEEEEASVEPRGERRKQLPSIPDSETLNAMANKTNNKSATAHKGGSGYSMFFLEYTLMAEYNKLHKQKLPGVYVIPSALTPLVWNGVLFVRQGQYQDGVFKFTVNIPENFPHGECPRVIFEFPLFHPVVDPHTGELDVKRGFPKWRPKVHEICQVLLYTRRIFYKIDTKSPLNEMAAQLYEQDMEQFKKKVTETVQKSKDLLYSDDTSLDPHAIIFSPWDPDVHEEARRQMLNLKKTPNDEDADLQRKNGLSWMKCGSNQIFSREDSATA